MQWNVRNKMKKKFFIKNTENQAELKRVEEEISIAFDEGDVIMDYEEEAIEVDCHDNPDRFNQLLFIVRSINPKINLVEKEDTKKYRKVLFLDGLDCANCALKIERIAKRSLSHEFISVDFTSARFIIETKDEKTHQNIIDEVSKITSMVDPSVQVKTKSTIRTTPKSLIDTKPKLDLILFIIGVGLFLTGVIIRFALQSVGTILPDWTILLMYTIAYILLGKDVLYGAFKNIISGRFFDEKFLMTLATSVSLGIGFYEEAVSVMIFYKIGEFFQEYAVNKSRKSISSLLDIKPPHANLLVNNEVVEVDPAEICEGDIIYVKSGERVPVDGIIIEGESSLDVSALTGESKLVDVGVGNDIISGSINTTGVLKVQVDKIYEDSMVAQILHMVENASMLKSKSEKLISKLAKYYTPIIVIFALFLALSPILFHSWNFQDSIYSATIFLVASCPCALVISVPLGFFGGIGGASKHGILIKGSNYLEALADLGGIAFDKTGTLTKGQFTVGEIVAHTGSKHDILEFAAYCEFTSSHPIARSIITEYGEDNIDTSRIRIHSKGMKNGTRIYLDEEEIAIGNAAFMHKIKVKVPEINSDDVIVYVVKNQEYVGHIIMQDEIRTEAKAVIKQLKERGIKTAMFTGDKEVVASEVAESVGIDMIYAGMSPIDKVKKLRQMKKTLNKKKQAFIGDGINDAPVLSSADVGIAMGGLGSDAAIKVADVVLMDDDLTKIPLAIDIAKKTKQIVYQNIAFALVVKIIVLALAPVGISHLWEAIFADVGVSLLAILNSLRAARINKRN